MCKDATWQCWREEKLAEEYRVIDQVKSEKSVNQRDGEMGIVGIDKEREGLEFLMRECVGLKKIQIDIHITGACIVEGEEAWRDMVVDGLLELFMIFPRKRISISVMGCTTVITLLITECKEMRVKRKLLKGLGTSSMRAG